MGDKIRMLNENTKVLNSLYRNKEFRLENLSMEMDFIVILLARLKLVIYQRELYRFSSQTDHILLVCMMISKRQDLEFTVIHLNRISCTTCIVTGKQIGRAHV